MSRNSLILFPISNVFPAESFKMSYFLDRRFIAAFVFTMGIVGQASAGSITYDLVNYPDVQDGNTLSGTITTDGAIGNLQMSDITAWSVTISQGAG